MKSRVLIFTIATVTIIAVAFVFLKQNLFPEEVKYTWKNINIISKLPKKEEAHLAARWGNAEATLEEIYQRTPRLKDKQEKADELEQLAFDSQYYFQFLQTSLQLLTEKIAIQQDLKSKVPPNKNLEAEYAKWKAQQKITDKDLSPQQARIVKMDLDYKYQQDQILKILAETNQSPLEIFLLAPQKKMEWLQDGIATYGDEKAKNMILFLCDMETVSCFQGLEILKQLADANPAVKIKYQPAFSGDNVHAMLRIQTGACIAKKDMKRFWEYYSSLANAPRMEQPELFEHANLKDEEMVEVRECIGSQESRKQWVSYQELYKNLWAPTLPFTVVNGEPILGSFTYDRVSEALARRSSG